MARSLYSRFFWVKFNNYVGPWAKSQALLWHYQTSRRRGRPRHLEFYQISFCSPPKGKDIWSNNRGMSGPLPGPKHWLVALGPFSYLDPQVALQWTNFVYFIVAEKDCEWQGLNECWSTSESKQSVFSAFSTRNIRAETTKVYVNVSDSTELNKNLTFV